ncbi:MAG: hypothetical protein NVSMB54_07290 [Ktedonobacteraceae bacterium]
MSDMSSESEILAPVADSLAQTASEHHTSRITRPLTEAVNEQHTSKITQPLAETWNEQHTKKITRPLVEHVMTEPERRDPVTPIDLPVLVIDTPQKQQRFEPTTDPVSTVIIPPVRSHVTLRQRLAGHKAVSLLLLILLLASISVPTVEGVLYGIQVYATYTALRSHASNGVQHLLNVKSIFVAPKTSVSTTSSTTSKFLDASTLLRAKKELHAAHSDFALVQSLLAHTSFIPLVEQYLPQYRPQISSARAASQVGTDVTNIGDIVINTAITLAPKFRGPLLNASQTPLVTSADLAVVGSTIDAVLPYVNDIQQQTQGMSLAALPVSTHQREQVQQLIQLLPQVKTALVQGRSLLGAVGWLLGVDGQRTFLVQTMDRAELRATGGFTGQYGELHIAGGRVAPFSLRDISLIEYANNSPTSDQLAPNAYRSWWPFANWGLRDSNLSADFPTSAQIAINEYNYEVRHRLDGVILFTPFLIEHVLQVTGPIHIQSYNETITAQNLESRLHYYQLDNAGIAKQISISSGDTSTSDRKHFTSLVAHTLMDTVRHESPTMLLALAKQMLKDMQTKDLQVYLTNPQLQGLLSRYGYAAQMDRSTTHDGLYVVQSNVSASKASQYVKTMMHDTVTLDSNGGATHLLQMQLAYNQLGFVYGLDTYRDYVRVYVPPTAKFLGGTGFDTGTPLCGGPLDACKQNGIYQHDEMVCATGQYDAGASAPMLNDNYTGQWHPLDKIGAPTNMTSDETGRAMFGGFVVIPKNCTMTVTLSWYVPPIGHSAYNLLVQRQAGTFPELDLTVLPTPGDCATLQTQGLHVDSVLGQDTSFTLAKKQVSNACYPQPNV